MRTTLLLLTSLLLPVAGAAQEGAQAAPTEEPGTNESATSDEGAVSEDPEAPYGRDEFGNPLPAPAPAIPPEEAARQLFEEGVALHKGLGGAEPDLAEARNRFERALQQNPDLSQAQYDLATIQLEMNELGEAQRALTTLTSEHRDLLEGWVALGISYERAGELPGAASAYRSCGKQDPEYVPCLEGLARIDRKEERYQDAIRDARKIIEINANSLDAFNTLGLAYIETGEYELARFVFSKAKASVPGGEQSASLECNKGLLHFREGKEYLAEMSFMRARELDPNHTATMVNLSHLKLKNLDYAGAAELLEEAHKRLPRNPTIRLNLAVARRGLDDLDGAEELLDGLLDDPDAAEFHADATWNKAVLLADFRKDYEASKALFKEWIAAEDASGNPIGEDHEVYEYIKQIDRAIKREERRRKRAAKKAERDARKKAEAEAEAATAAEEGSGDGDSAEGDDMSSPDEAGPGDGDAGEDPAAGEATPAEGEAP